jgi:hypothetical protein
VPLTTSDLSANRNGQPDQIIWVNTSTKSGADAAYIIDLSYSTANTSTPTWLTNICTDILTEQYPTGGSSQPSTTKYALTAGSTLVAYYTANDTANVQILKTAAKVGEYVKVTRGSTTTYEILDDSSLLFSVKMTADTTVDNTKTYYAVKLDTGAVIGVANDGTGAVKSATLVDTAYQVAYDGSAYTVVKYASATGLTVGAGKQVAHNSTIYTNYVVVTVAGDSTYPTILGDGAVYFDNVTFSGSTGSAGTQHTVSGSKTLGAGTYLVKLTSPISYYKAADTSYVNTMVSGSDLGGITTK